MTAQQLWIASLAFAALAVLLLAGAMLWQLRRSARAAALVGEVLHRAKPARRRCSRFACPEPLRLRHPAMRKPKPR